MDIGFSDYYVARLNLAAPMLMVLACKPEAIQIKFETQRFQAI